MIFDSQKHEVLNAIDQQGIGLSYSAHIKAIDAEDLLDVDKWDETVAIQAKRVYLAAILDAATDQLRDLDIDKRFLLDQKPVMDFVDKYSRKGALSINKTTIERIDRVIKTEIDAGTGAEKNDYRR